MITPRRETPTATPTILSVVVGEVEEVVAGVVVAGEVGVLVVLMGKVVALVVISVEEVVILAVVGEVSVMVSSVVLSGPIIVKLGSPLPELSSVPVV